MSFVIGLSIMETMQIIGVIATVIFPLLLMILTILYRKGVISKKHKEQAEEVIKILSGSIDHFKTIDKSSSKGLTSIIGKKVENAPVKEHLEGYLKKFNGNGNGEK